MPITTENDFATYTIDNGIIEIIYKEQVVLDLPSAVQVVKDRLLLHEGRFLPILCDIRGLGSLNKAARTYLAKEGSVLIKAVAVLIDSPVSQTLSQFFMYTRNPPVPMKSFFDKETALRFLNDFKD